MAERRFGENDPDYSAEITQEFTDSLISQIRQKSEIKPGEPGECDLCGEWSGRLINAVCAPCRDKYKLP